MQSMLIVDDQPDLRMLLRFTFMDSGFDVREAVDGESALAACRTAMPDIVLLDVMMPGVDGYEVCRQLKADPLARNTIVVLMTAGHQATERARAQAAGADLYFAKPFSPNELLKVVRAFAQGELQTD
jgi:CheY-like chemotaxis protein